MIYFSVFVSALLL